MILYLLNILLWLSYAWTNTPTYIAARIAEIDLQAHDPYAYNKTLALLQPLDELTFSGKHPFLDAAVYTNEASKAGFTLTDTWFYQFTPFYDGLKAKEFERHKRFDMLRMIHDCQTTVDFNGNWRIDKTFGKSYCLRYIFNQVINLHQPMRNVIRFSSSFPEGDNFGKLHSIDHQEYSNLFELFDDGFGLFTSQSYPLGSLDSIDGYALDIISKYPRSSVENDINNIKKKEWNKDSFKIAKDFAYSLKLNETPSSNYLHKGEDIIKKQLALAGYRLSKLISYMMSKQNGSQSINNSKYKRRS